MYSRMYVRVRVCMYILFKGSSPKLKSACRKPDLSLSGLDPVPLSKMGTHLLASLGSKGKNRNSLACLRNAGSHSRSRTVRLKDNVSAKILQRPIVLRLFF